MCGRLFLLLTRNFRVGFFAAVFVIAAFVFAALFTAAVFLRLLFRIWRFVRVFPNRRLLFVITLFHFVEFDGSQISSRRNEIIRVSPVNSIVLVFVIIIFCIIAIAILALFSFHPNLSSGAHVLYMIVNAILDFPSHLLRRRVYDGFILRFSILQNVRFDASFEEIGVEVVEDVTAIAG